MNKTGRQAGVCPGGQDGGGRKQQSDVDGAQHAAGKVIPACRPHLLLCRPHLTLVAPRGGPSFTPLFAL